MIVRQYTPTPITAAGLRALDFEPSFHRAVVTAWKEAGKRPQFHQTQQQVVREVMPVLARQLDKAAYGEAPADAFYGDGA